MHTGNAWAKTEKCQFISLRNVSFRLRNVGLGQDGSGYGLEVLPESLSGAGCVCAMGEFVAAPAAGREGGGSVAFTLRPEGSSTKLWCVPA